MSRTDKTRPLRVQEYDDLPHWSIRLWSSRHKSAVKHYQREHNRRDRHDAHADLRREREPEPRQGRGRAWWEVW